MELLRLVTSPHLEPPVPFFKQSPSVIDQWPDFQQQMNEIEADWYYISGHHGRQFEAHTLYSPGLDYNNYHTRAPASSTSPITPAASRRRPSTTRNRRGPTKSSCGPARLGRRPAPMTPALQPPARKLRGMLLVGCNTMTTASRVDDPPVLPQRGRHRPRHPQVVRHLQDHERVRPLGREFFLDPKGTIDPAELAGRLTPTSMITYDYLAVMSDGNLHFRVGSQVRTVPHDKVLTKEDVTP